MRKNKKLSVLLCVTMCSVLLAACGSTAAETVETVETTETQSVVEETTTQTEPETMTEEATAPAEAAGDMGKVTAIDGDTITLVMADVPEGGAAPANGEASTDMEKPDGEQPTDMEKPADGEQGTEMAKPDGEASTDMEKPADGEQSTDMEKPADAGNGGSAEMQFTGEEQTITVTDATVITKDGSDTACTIDDIAVGSILRIVTDETSGDVTQIIIMSSQE
jgi:hypothetical protein